MALVRFACARSYRRLGTGARLLGIVQRLLCRRIAGDKGSLPLLRRPCSRQLRFGLRKLSLGRAHGEFKSRRIDGADGLPFADEVANVDGTRGQTSQHAEGKIGLVVRLNDAYGDGAIRAARFEDHRQHGPHGLRRFRLLLTSSE